MALEDLVTVYDSGTDKPTELSLSRAQMLFWTGLLLIVFVAKDGCSAACCGTIRGRWSR